MKESNDESQDAFDQGARSIRKGMQMGDMVTRGDSYVSGYKVVKSDHDTVTLESGAVVAKTDCRYISTDSRTGDTYYRYDDPNSEKVVVTADDSGYSQLVSNMRAEAVSMKMRDGDPAAIKSLELIAEWISKGRWGFRS